MSKLSLGFQFRAEAISICGSRFLNPGYWLLKHKSLVSAISSTLSPCEAQAEDPGDLFLEFLGNS